MWRCDFLRHHHIQKPKIQQRDALQTNGDIPVHVLYVFTRSYTFREQGKASSKAKLQDSLEQILQQKQHMERGYPQNFMNNTLSELWNFKKGQNETPTKQNKETNLAKISSNSSKSQLKKS